MYKRFLLQHTEFYKISDIENEQSHKKHFNMILGTGRTKLNSNNYTKLITRKIPDT